MRVRLAKLTDLSEIVAYGARTLPHTNYAPLGYNAVIARRTLKATMTDKDSRVWVSTDATGKIRGLLIGQIGQVPFSHFLAATDMVFVAEAGGELLLDAYLSWCKLRGVARIDLGVSAGPVREAAMVRLMRRKGLERAGTMFVANLIEGADVVGVKGVA
jgi:hypothetical protein